MAETNPLNGYGSHLPVLEMILKAFLVKSVLEFGPGLYSTRLFLEHGCKLHSIEMQEESWYDKIRHKYGHLKNFSIEFLPWTGSVTVDTEKRFDLVFVDGHIDSRPACINAYFGLADIILAHDFQKKCYRWVDIRQSEDYYQMIFAPGHRSTVCFIHKRLLTKLDEYELDSMD